MCDIEGRPTPPHSSLAARVGHPSDFPDSYTIANYHTESGIPQIHQHLRPITGENLGNTYEPSYMPEKPNYTSSGAQVSLRPTFRTIFFSFFLGKEGT